MQAQLRDIIITGCNKGIGYGILENLIHKNFKIVMACRNIDLAEEARQKVAKDNQELIEKVSVMQLDISNTDSINKFVEEIKAKNYSCDVLLNNAGMAFKGDAFDESVAKTTLYTNFFGTVDLTEKMLPYIKQGGKIIMVGSRAGLFNKVKSEQLLGRLKSNDLTLQELKDMGDKFIDDVKNGVWEKDWAKTTYGVSKVLVNAYPKVLMNYKHVIDQNIQVYSLCPGWIKTDMGGDKAPGTLEEGADTPVYLTELPHVVDPNLQGKFFASRQVTFLF